MKRKKSFIIIALILSTVIAVGIFALLKSKRSLIPSKPALFISGCFGWKRTGFMTKEENDIFTKLEEACSKRGVKEMRDILALDNRVHVLCRPLKKQFIEPESPVIEITIRNDSNKDTHILEPFLQRITLVSTKCDNIWIDKFDFGPYRSPRYLITLKPQQTYSFTRALSVEGYGKHEIKLSYSAGVWNEISETEKIMNSMVISRTSCEFIWDKKEDTKSTKNPSK